jgi:hypothetical protein
MHLTQHPTMQATNEFAYGYLQRLHLNSTKLKIRGIKKKEVEGLGKTQIMLL